MCFEKVSTLWEIKQSNTNWKWKTSYSLKCNGKKSFMCIYNIENDDYYFHMNAGHTFKVFIMNDIIHGLGWKFYGNKEHIGRL